MLKTSPFRIPSSPLLELSPGHRHPTALNIVCMGGGTGLPQLLTGFRLLAHDPAYADRVCLENLTALVTAFDDGGSSGRIIRAYRTLPPGDLRNCLLALADVQDEPLLTHFFNHRFREDETEALAGHSAGNLLLLLLSQVYGGDLRKALLSIRSILPIRSTILFPTLCQAVLCAQLEDGSIIRGESRIAERSARTAIARVFLEPREPGTAQTVTPMEGVLEAIAEADLITFGPGSLYTSVLPHFLVDGISEAVRRSPARKIYVCNLMTEVGETDGFTIQQHVTTLERLAEIRLDAVVANDLPVPEGMRRAYERERHLLEFRKAHKVLERAFERALESPGEAGAFERTAEHTTEQLRHLARQLGRPGSSFVQVLPRADEALRPGLRLITSDLLALAEVPEQGGGTKKVIRHEPRKLAQTLLGTSETAQERGHRTHESGGSSD